MNEPESPSSALASLQKHWWLWLAAALALLKLALLRAQPIYAIGNAAHDDLLFLRLARFIADGQWLGPYDHFTLAKGAVYPAFVAANHYLGLPLRFTEELVYVGACALLVRALAPLALAGWTRLLVFAALLWNPLTFEGLHMTRILRQHLTVPFALIVAAALIALVLRKDRSLLARLPWALLGGLTLGLFWNTREEGIWILGMTALLGAGAFSALWTGPGPRRARDLVLVAAAAAIGFAPQLTISALNQRHYGWFGTNEFHAADFRAAYGALTRVRVGPERPYVAVSREAREAIYRVSPAFAELQPYLEGEIGERWANAEGFRRTERQIGSGWFMWALRDAVAAAGHTKSAADALAFYRRLADEVNRACDEGKLPATRRRSGFFPRWHPAYTHAVLTGAPAYLAGLLDFSTFEPNPPYSVGTDDEVRLFRDLTHDRISPAPRATYIELPAQRVLDAAKLDWLRAAGRTLGATLKWFLLLAHAAALVRLVQLVRARRHSFLFGLAVAVWCGAAAELALNILVHTTSFPNYYPAAYAPAFPLLILFGLLIALDVSGEWRAPVSRGFAAVRAAIQRRPAAAWALGVGLVVFAARLREIALFGGDVPFLDQWRAEAQDILTPWLRGELSVGAFFAPHHEHIPVWTRLLAWLQAALLGTWHPPTQMVLNAALHATWAALLAGWFRRQLGNFAASAATLLLLAVAGLAHAWENITWGFQSQFPLALLCLFGFVRGSLTQATGSRGWWIAQAIGAAGLFTLGSFWTAPLLVAAVNLWCAPRAARAWLAPLGLAAMGALLLALAIRAQPATGALALRAGDLREFLHVWLHSLGWPLAAPGAAVLLNLPLLFLAVRLRGAHDAGAFDRALLIFGLWSVAQAAGLAYARGASGPDFVSRYSDLAALGALANGLALLRLAGASRLWLVPAAAWIAGVAVGLHDVNTTGHAAYFHEHGAARAAFRREAVAEYLQHDDSTKLRSLEGRGLIYPNPTAVMRQLDDPRFVALLPGSVTGRESAPVLGVFVARAWPALLLLGIAFALLAFTRVPAALPPAVPVATAAWIPLGGVALASLAAFLLWPRPFAWNQEQRWERLFYPATPLRDLSWSFSEKTDYASDRLWGAAALAPEALRNLFIGTHVDGPGFTGGARSASFVIEAPWLVVPVAGYPASEGNSVSLVIEGGPLGLLPTTLRCAEPNPRSIGVWLIDVGAHRGKKAHLELRDGRAADEGWLAVAPPQPALEPAAATRLAAAWAAERAIPARTTLLAAALVTALAATFALLRARNAKET